MFGFFKKRSPDAASEEEISLMRGAVDAVIGQQLFRANRSWADLLAARFTIGYVMGVCDAIAQKRGIPEGNDVVVIQTALGLLFPVAPQLFAAIGGLQDDPQYAAGQHWGGTDMLTLLADRTRVPSGLCDFWAANPSGGW